MSCYGQTLKMYQLIEIKIITQIKFSITYLVDDKDVIIDKETETTRQNTESQETHAEKGNMFQINT